MVEEFGPRGGAISRFPASLRTHLFRNSIFLLATAVAGYGLSFVFWLLVARLYPADNLGLAATLLSTIYFLAGAATLGLTLGVIRFLPNEGDKVGLANASMTLAGLVALGLAAVFLAGLDIWAPGLAFVRADPALLLGVVISVPGFAISAILESVCVAARRADYGMVRNLTFNLVRLPIPAIVAVALGVLGIMFAWILAIIVGLAIGVGVLLPRLFPGYRPIPSLHAVRRRDLVGYSLWNQGSTIVGSAALTLLPLLILNTAGPTGGPATAAYFYAAFTVASLLYVVPGSFSTSLFVEGSHPGTSYAADVRRTAWLSAGLLVLGVLAAILLGRWILGIFGPDYAREAYETLILLALASPVVLANTIFTTDLRVAKRVRALLTITAITSGSTLVLGYALLPSLGIWGAGVAFVFGQVLALPMFVLERRQNGRIATAAKGPA